jgi:son of sevenless-like protein
MQSANDVHEMYDTSLQVEPREREDEKIARYGDFVASLRPNRSSMFD